MMFATSCDRSLFLSAPNYATTIIGVAPPAGAKNLRIIRDRNESPLIQWNMEPSEFEAYQKVLTRHGYSDWKKEPYDIHDPVPLLKRITIGGFAIGSTATVAEGKLNKGKTSVRIYYDYPSKTLVAVQGN